MAAGQHTSLVSLSYRPLVSTTGAGVSLTAHGQHLIQPVGILETDLGASASPNEAGIDEGGDAWVVRFISPGNYDDLVFLMMNMNATLVCAYADAAEFSAMWSADVLYQTVPYVNGAVVWHAFQTDATLRMHDGNVFRAFMDIDPPLVGLPSRPMPGYEAIPGLPYTRSLGAFQFRVLVFDADANANSILFTDARWLAYPRTAADNAALYAPLQYTQPS